MKINAESQKSIIKIELFVNKHMSNYFQIHESRWTNAYIVGDEKSFNLHLRKQYIIDEIQKLE